MSIDTITLQCFLAVAESQSFTKAAQRVGRSQSAISQQIAKLENLIETPLINRGRELSLTPDGEIFLGYAKRMYALHRESLDRFKAPALQGDIRFGVPEDFASMLLSEVLVEFSRRHPRVLLKVECDLTQNLTERFTAGDFDLILTKMTQYQLDTESVRVCTEPVVWIGKKELLPMMDRQSQIPLVLSPSPCRYHAMVVAALDKAGMGWRLAYSSSSYMGKMAAVRAGLGITAIQRRLIPEYLDVLDEDCLPVLDNIHVALLKNKKAGYAVESLEHFILQKLKH
ncbi:MAG: LysR family transcriptional regulator [Legionellaceae bacterium]|nr:LysR family transcriptional regulator [Legionellaceae bacterium]